MLRSPIVAPALFRGLVEHSTVGTLALEEIGGVLKIAFANSSALEMLELKSIDGASVEDFFPKEDRLANVRGFNSEMLSRDGMTSEVMLKKANLHHFLAAVGVKRLEIDGHKIALVSLRDITIERKLARDLEAKQAEITRAYMELLEQNLQLKQLDQAKDKFIALTTHELRTPISAILATADVLELKLYESEEQREEFIRTISEQGRHLLELVNDVLDFAKIRAGKMDFYVESIDLQALVPKITQHFSNMAVSENIRIELNLESKGVVWADALRLREIVNNVMSNAIKYNRTNGSVTVSLAPHTGSEGRSFMRLTIRDTGLGIPADKMESVFNEFETVGYVSRHQKGTGLGMPISRRLIESMGGALTLKSEVGVGTEFYIDIPTEKVLAEEVYRSRPEYDADLFAA